MTSTIARHAQSAPVRIGNGNVPHLGHLTTTGTPDSPRYAARCGAGNRYPNANTPLVVATGPAVDQDITCRNCTRQAGDTVARVNAERNGQTALIDPPAPHADAVRWAAIVADGRTGSAALAVARLAGKITGAGWMSPRWCSAAVRHVLAAAETEAYAALAPALVVTLTRSAPVAPEDARGDWAVWGTGGDGGYRETVHPSRSWAFYRAEQLARRPGVLLVSVDDIGGPKVPAGTWVHGDGWAFHGPDAAGHERAAVKAGRLLAECGAVGGPCAECGAEAGEVCREFNCQGTWV